MALCVHWFNPLVWLSYALMSRDMEMSCDEKVINELGSDIKKAYSTSLLSLAANRKMIGASPLAFGETGAKERIKNVLNYKRPAFWVTVAAVIAVAAIGIGLLANPDISVHSDEEKIHMVETWAEALKTRDGKPRYEIMSKTMKEKFIAGQKQRAKPWNYNIGVSSPWVVSYDTEIKGETATITYHLTDSVGGKYIQTEIITFGQENNKMTVTDASVKDAEAKTARVTISVPGDGLIHIVKIVVTDAVGISVAVGPEQHYPGETFDRLVTYYSKGKIQVYIDDELVEEELVS